MPSRPTLWRLALLSFVANLVAWCGLGVATRVLGCFERRETLRRRARRLVAERAGAVRTVVDPLAS